MADCEAELFKLGVPVKTRHNEVAPSQYEIAPIFEDSNLATDHQMLTMEILRRTADKYGLACLLHEKPFAGINGSGKHNNWSMSTDTGENLLNPGDTPHDNAQFLVFCVAVIRAVAKYPELLRVSVAQRGQRSPPRGQRSAAGHHLDLPRRSASGRDRPARKGRGPKTTKQGGVMEIGVSVLPKLPRDAGDRNRTSPFAFTGNKFEFRAVGGSQSIAGPNTVLNTIVAESLDFIATKLEKAAQDGGKDLNKAIQDLLPGIIKEARRSSSTATTTRRNGTRRPERRGLPNLRNTVDALPVIIRKDSIELFGKYKVYSERELQSRFNILCEDYVKTVNIEARLTAMMARTMILPAALRYQAEVAGAVTPARRRASRSGPQTDLLKSLDGGHRRLPDGERRARPRPGPPRRRRSVRPRQARPRRGRPGHEPVRTAGDRLEGLVADDLWPLPTYREMLFIK